MKNLTRVWVNGLQRLFSAHHQTLDEAVQQAAQGGGMAAPGTAAPGVWPNPAPAASAAPAAGMRTPGGAPQHESRVGPRAAAWAAGEWRRAVYTPERAGSTLPALAYGLYVPAAPAGGQNDERGGQNGPARKRPLVVMLHGCNQCADPFAEGTRMNLLADHYGFAVLYPEQSETAHAHRCWHWYDPRARAGGAEARAVTALVDALVSEHGFDAARVYLAGMSAGAGLAAQLAVREPYRFAAVALHSGPVFGEAHSGITAMDVMRRGTRHDPRALVEQAVRIADYPGMPALIVQGDEDAIVAPVNADQLAAQFLYLNGLMDMGAGIEGIDINAGIDASASHAQPAEIHEERHAGYALRDYRRAGRSIVRVCHVDHLGHAWSGGDETIPFHSASGPDASAMIWDFFREQRRDAQAVNISVDMAGE